MGPTPTNHRLQNAVLPKTASAKSRFGPLRGLRTVNRRRVSPSLARSFVLLVGVLGTGTALQAQEYRVDSQVLLEGQSKPVVENRTLFSGGVVHDFLLSGDEEITVLDLRRGRLILLDRKRRVKTIVSTKEVLEFVDLIRGRLEGPDHGDLLARGMSTQYDEDSGWLTLAGDRVSYRVRGITPEMPEAVAQYRQCADWLARLNAMRPGNLPPFARLRLNEALAHQKLIPVTVERTMRLRDRKQVARSRHLTHWKLSGTDRKWIDQADRAIASYRPVSLPNYLGLK